jgi:hypothetical protein
MGAPVDGRKASYIITRVKTLILFTRAKNARLCSWHGVRMNATFLSIVCTPPHVSNTLGMVTYIGYRVVRMQFIEGIVRVVFKLKPPKILLRGNDIENTAQRKGV